MEPEDNNIDPYTTRAEYRENVLGDNWPEEDGPTFFQRSRKAFVAAAGAACAVVGPAIIATGSDGVFDWAREGAPLLVTGLTLTVGTFILTWYTKNESA